MAKGTSSLSSALLIVAHESKKQIQNETIRLSELNGLARPGLTDALLLPAGKGHGFRAFVAEVSVVVVNNASQCDTTKRHSVIMTQECFFIHARVAGTRFEIE